MVSYTVILLVASGFCAWLAYSELAVAFAPARASGMAGRRAMAVWGCVAIVAGGVLPGSGTSEKMAACFAFSSYVPVVIAVVAAALAAYATRRLGFSSPVYALAGALAAWVALTHPAAEWGLVLRLPLAWIAAAVWACLLAWGLQKGYMQLAKGRELHLLKLSARLRIAVVVSMLVLALAVGVNNGALVMGILSGASPDFGMRAGALYLDGRQLLWMAVFPIGAWCVGRWARGRMAQAAQRDMDFDPASLAVVMLAAGIAMLCFSFDGAVAWTGLAASPLSAAHIALAAVAGTGLARGRYRTGLQSFGRTFLSAAGSSLLAFGIAYALLGMTMDVIAPGYNMGTLSITAPTQYNLTVPLFGVLFALAVATLLVLVFKYRRIKAEAMAASVEQQQQLFEKQRDITDLEIRQVLMENETLSHRLELRRNELVSMALSISEQKEFLEAIRHAVREARRQEDPAARDEMLAGVESMVMQRMNFSQESERLYTQAEVLHKDFGLRLSEKYPRLTAQERKLTTFLRLGFSTKYIATLMNISPKSVDIGRYRLRGKFGLERDQKLTEFIKTI